MREEGQVSDTVTTTTTSAPAAPAAIGPGEVASPPQPGPGWKTSEFWLKLASLALAPIYASGMITNDVAESIVLMIITVLGAMGYGVNRSLVKSAASRASLVVVSGLVTPPPR